MIITSPIEHWRLIKNRYQLEGTVCVSCEKKYYPYVNICSCGSREFAPKKLRGHGTIISFTEILTSTRLFKDSVPYCLALIKLDDGPVILAQVADANAQDLSIGLVVRSVFRRYFIDGQDGLVYYGIKFVPEFLTGN